MAQSSIPAMSSPARTEQAAQRRTRSWWRDRLEYATVRLVISTLRWLPFPLALRCARGCMQLLARAVPKLSRVARRNLEVALPGLSPEQCDRVVREVFVTLARSLAVFSRFARIGKQDIGRWIRYQGFEHFERALGLGRGVLFATAHLGNWELSAFAHALLSAPMHVVVRPLDNPLLNAFIERERQRSGNRIIGKREYARSILRALAANQAVGILIDQNAAEGDGIFVDFFGVPACTSPSFVKLAFRSGAAVIPGFAVWSEAENRYVLRFYPEVPMTGDAAADTARLQKQLEEVIREYPGQWLWVHRRWKTRPPGTPALY